MKENERREKEFGVSEGGKGGKRKWGEKKMKKGDKEK
jgi:hypothetical protein